MKTVGIIILLAGMFMFTTGLVFLDLASLPLKNDLYTLDVLGLFNNMFSLNPPIARFQSFLSIAIIMMGCAICYSGCALIKK
jgi:hypothetical protein